ncbi:hypothetical protein [Sporichthya brevicatena]|uniref:hypothetical protein n=1 Tax=Sporichthya brevicatena TaxID=171442 RepID=UPI0031D95BAA
MTAPPRARPARHGLIRDGSRGHAADWSPRLIPTDAPWERRHLVRLGVWMAVGLVGIGVSWFQISGEGDWHDQIRWIIVGSVAVGVSGLGTAGWLMAASRAVHLEAHDVMAQLRIQQQFNDGTGLGDAGAARGGAVEREAPVDPSGPFGYVSGPTMTRVHVASCALVAGKVVSPVSDSEIAARGLARCGVCCA